MKQEPFIAWWRAVKFGARITFHEASTYAGEARDTELLLRSCLQSGLIVCHCPSKKAPFHACLFELRSEHCMEAVPPPKPRPKPPKPAPKPAQKPSESPAKKGSRAPHHKRKSKVPRKATWPSDADLKRKAEEARERSRNRGKPRNDA